MKKKRAIGRRDAWTRSTSATTDGERYEKLRQRFSHSSRKRHETAESGMTAAKKVRRK
jgi:hypothetical protein